MADSSLGYTTGTRVMYKVYRLQSQEALDLPDAVLVEFDWHPDTLRESLRPTVSYVENCSGFRKIRFS